ncbi:MAG: prolyl oligopeptidase family serine peptidase [Bacteroidales bacterium]|nr:prolyl oligopeptidase family serine peptidase [Bacteroidales bacterium]
MNKIICFVLLTFLAMACKDTSEPLSYPETKKGDVVDNYHGTEVPDPYRWLEDDNSEETKAWVEAQKKVSFGYLESIPFRDELKERLTEVWDYPKMGNPVKRQGIYFYSYNSGLQNQNVVYKLNSLDENGEIFLDPNTFSEDGTVALTNYAVSHDAKYFAYGISRAGSDWQEFFVRDIETGEDLDDHLKWIKFSGISWYKDGFYYSRYPEPTDNSRLTGSNENNKVYFHKIGTPQSADQLVYADPEHPQRGFNVGVTDDEKYAIITSTESTSGNAFGFKKIEDKTFTWLVDSFEKDYSPIGNNGNILYVITNLDAPRYKLVAINLDDPAKENWSDLIPEREEVLQSCSFMGGKLIASYLKDAYDVVEVFDTEGTFLHEIEFPGIGSVNGFGGDEQDNVTFYTFTSFNYPPVIYKYNIEENLSEVFYRTDIDFDSDDYETRQVFFESKDGTKVPMFIVHRKGLRLNGKNPTILYGYGGFNITYTPSFSSSRTVWLEQGGIYALANIRGGGEYGEEWHKAGTILNKQNVFDDFIAAAEYLIDEKYTSPEKLGILGGSNGGLLVGAVTNQRPELFAAAIPAVGVMDMLRFHKFTIGRYWTTDYGSSDDPEQFEYIYKYSPLHNISKEKEYPAVMVTTADHDDRVVPAHSFKYIATLQEKYTGNNPVIIRIETDAGHGAGKPTSKYIEEQADQFAFYWYNMGFEPTF